MGGALLGMGNVPEFPNSEFNFYCDSCAVELVFRSISNIYMVPFETCIYTDHLTKALGGKGLFGPEGGFVEKCFKHGCFIVDPLAVMFAMDKGKDHRVARVRAKVKFDGDHAPIMLHWLT
jgi:inosine-uridine nucleoside N-ribohydrolase